MSKSDGEKRVVLVTGGAKRVGRAIVETMAARGWEVVFTYNTSRDESASVKSTNADISCVKADFNELDRYEKELRAAVEAKGQLNALVNCASIYQPDPAGWDQAFHRRMFAVNLEAPLRLADWFAPMLRASRGHVVNMVDLLAERPWPKFRAYCASKAALANATLSLARQLAPEVTVNGIAPGVVDWPPGFPDDEKAKYLRRVPLDRAGTPEDVANLVHFLLTQGSYITGQIIRLDGGRSIT
nr:Enoyl-(Acyl carrier protein) reductase [uncultured bacterium]